MNGVSTSGKQQPDNDMRRKFREALERKQRKDQAPGQGPEDDGTAKSHGKQAPAQRMFRRKSG